MNDELELFIEKISATTVTFGGRDSGSEDLRQLKVSRKAWANLGKPEGVVVKVRAR